MGCHSCSTNQPYQYVGELGYYTHHQDANLALLQLGVRFYDSEIGRFTQRDALPETLNAYEYVASRSLGLVDPDGLSSKKVNPREREADIDEIGLLSAACAYLVRLRAIRDAQAQFPGKDLWDNSYRNAVMHCYWTALIAACCGRNAAATVTNNHEKYNWDPSTGPMDLGNNKNGLACFDNLKPCTGGVTRSRDWRTELMKCCKDAKPVYVPGKPVPEYPGGNK